MDTTKQDALLSAREVVHDYLVNPHQAKLSPEQALAYQAEIKQLLKEHNAVLVAHYYTDPMIQALAEETGGCVSDSLEMARFGSKHPAETLIVAGVKFMGETAKILTPISACSCLHWRLLVHWTWAVRSMSSQLFVTNTQIALSLSMPIPRRR